jgi:ABC-type lipoprotein release transport system permease subunit
MALTVAPGPDSTAPLEVRLRYLRRRKRPNLRTIAVGAVMVIALAWTLLVGLGLLLR